jgi:hypothetical protein
VNPDFWNRESAIAGIKREFNISGKLFETYAHPYLYISTDVKNNVNIDQRALEAAVVEAISKLGGVSQAVSSAALRDGGLPDTFLNRAIVNNFNAKRSGDIYVVFEPNWFINDFDGLTVASTHGSPWQYDTYVPIVFAGAGLQARTVDRKVYTVDIAATLSAYLNIKAPSGSVGVPLREVLRGAAH